MRRLHRLAGFGPKETLLAVVVIGITAAIIIPIGLRSNNKDLILNESARMRRVYIGLALYEGEYDNQPSPNLLGALTFEPDQANYQSNLDPFVHMNSTTSPNYPADAGLENGEQSRFRISFSYLQDFVRANKITIKPWADARLDPSLGELANEWLGTVQPQQFPRALVGGRLLRIGTDGAVFVLTDRGGPKPLGDTTDLFTRTKH